MRALCARVLDHEAMFLALMLTLPVLSRVLLESLTIVHGLVSHQYFCSCIQDGTTALLYAAMNGHADCARLLLDAGADLETTDVVRWRKPCRNRQCCFHGDFDPISSRHPFDARRMEARH